MKYFLDTEFYEDGTTIDLISIGIVCEDGREFYACNASAVLERVSPWVREHVLPQLPSTGDAAWMTHAEIASKVRDFVRGEAAGKPQIWAYYADYDWVVLCQLFGTMMDLPQHFPMFCMDLKQLSVEIGSPEHPEQEVGEHNALADARWNRDLYAFLRSFDTRPETRAKLEQELRLECVQKWMEAHDRFERFVAAVRAHCAPDNPLLVTIAEYEAGR
jgi:hypothetical protein